MYSQKLSAGHQVATSGEMRQGMSQNIYSLLRGGLNVGPGIAWEAAGVHLSLRQVMSHQSVHATRQGPPGTQEQGFLFCPRGGAPQLSMLGVV